MLEFRLSGLRTDYSYSNTVFHRRDYYSSYFLLYAQIKRDYDEEEKGFASGSEDKEKEVTEVPPRSPEGPALSPEGPARSPERPARSRSRSPEGPARSPPGSPDQSSSSSSSPPQLDSMEKTLEKDTDHQTVDMDMSD